MNIRIEEDEYIVQLVEETKCTPPCIVTGCMCTGDHLITTYTTIAVKKHKELPPIGSIEEKQLMWILRKIKGEDVGVFPRESIR